MTRYLRPRGESVRGVDVCRVRAADPRPGLLAAKDRENPGRHANPIDGAFNVPAAQLRSDASWVGGLAIRNQDDNGDRRNLCDDLCLDTVTTERRPR